MESHEGTSGSGGGGSAVTEWVNDGVSQLLGSDNVIGVLWHPVAGAQEVLDEGAPRVTSMYKVTRNRAGRYSIDTTTTYAVGVEEDEWVHVEHGAGSYHDYETRREAQAWARRDAELEAANPHAVSWDGQPS